MRTSFVARGFKKNGKFHPIGNYTNVPKTRCISSKDVNSETTTQFAVHSTRSLNHKTLHYLKTPIERIGRGVLINFILGAVSTAIANPAPVLIYHIYKKANYAYKIYQKIHNSEKGKLYEELVKKSVRNVTNLYPDTLAEMTTESAKDSGYFKEISKYTSQNEEIVSRMFSSTLQKGLRNGTDSLTDFVVEGML